VFQLSVFLCGPGLNLSGTAANMVKDMLSGKGLPLIRR
jgi:hypothetical protein